MTETPETDAANDLQCELAAWELLSEARRERDESLEKLTPLRQSLCDSQDEVLRLTFENRELNQGIDEALILGNKLADECERILGLGLHQNTIERFKAALEAWKDYNNE